MKSRTDATRLAELCEDARQHLFPALTRDRLLTSPRSAVQVCNRVREQVNRTARTDCPDEVILWAYLNASKRSKLAGPRPRGKGRAK